MRAFELAERLGWSVGELGERMSAREFVEWGAFDAVRPNTGEELRHALLMLMVAIVGRLKSPPRLDQLLPNRWHKHKPPEPPRAMGPAEIRASLDHFRKP